MDEKKIIKIEKNLRKKMTKIKNIIGEPLASEFDEKFFLRAGVYIVYIKIKRRQITTSFARIKNLLMQLKLIVRNLLFMIS